MSRAWMPLYVADYLADTGHLSAAEHGAYLLLIMHYWQNGGVPNEDKRLARIARMTPDEWSESRETLAALFDDGWSHNRIDDELAAAEEISAKAKAKAEKRWGKPVDAGAHATAIPQVVPQTCQSQSPTTIEANAPIVERAKRKTRIDPNWAPSESGLISAEKRNLYGPDRDREVSRFVSHHTAKGNLMASWDAAWITWLDSPYRQTAQGTGPPRNVSNNTRALQALDEVIPNGPVQPQPRLRLA